MSREWTSDAMRHIRFVFCTKKVVSKSMNSKDLLHIGCMLLDISEPLVPQLIYLLR